MSSLKFPMFVSVFFLLFFSACNDDSLSSNGSDESISPLAGVDKQCFWDNDTVLQLDCDREDDVCIDDYASAQDSLDEALFVCNSGSSSSLISSSSVESIDMPSVNVTEGAYGPTQFIQLSTNLEGASIFYTLNGKDPSTTSWEFEGEDIVIETNTILKAIVVSSEGVKSPVLTANYTINGQLETPTIDIPSTVTEEATLKLKLHSSNPQAIIYYTLDGTKPSQKSLVYTDKILLTKSATLKAIAILEGWTSSEVLKEVYAFPGTSQTPIANMIPGVHTTELNIDLSIASTNSKFKIYYTLDGSIPSASSIEYINPFVISNTTTLRAITIHEDKTRWLDSPIMTNHYIITGTLEVPKASVTGGVYSQTQTITLTTDQPDADIYYTTDGSVPTQTSNLYSGSIKISQAQTISAIAFKKDWIESPMMTEVYDIQWCSIVGADELCDDRDGQLYKKVSIGTQTWMAQDLNYATSGSSASGDSRYYYYTTARDGASASLTIPSGIKGVCPTNWHLPSEGEWDLLASYISSNQASGSVTDGRWSAIGGFLKSTSTWEVKNGYGPGTDDYGFNAKPNGMWQNSGFFINQGESGHWHTASDKLRKLSSWDDDLSYYSGYYKDKFAVRCVQD